jgi:GR25 family glycosyltransferase involved in LPS biosynthesis
MKYFFFALFFVSVLQADIQNHFKKALDKPLINAGGVRNIDFIYLINLDPRAEKWTGCVERLAPYQIYPYRFSAVNGWELSLETLYDLGIKYQKNYPKNLMATYYDETFTSRHELMHVPGRTYFCHHMSRGAIGCILSHLSVLQDAYDAGYNTIWVMEDDIEIIQNPHLITDLISKLDAVCGSDGWDVLFTDRDTKNSRGEYVPCRAIAKRPNFSPAFSKGNRIQGEASQIFRKISCRYGSYSMIIRRSGIEKILDFFKRYQMFLPYDLDYIFPPDIKLYTVLQDVVSTQPQAPSDNGRPNYAKQD